MPALTLPDDLRSRLATDRRPVESEEVWRYSGIDDLDLTSLHTVVAAQIGVSGAAPAPSGSPVESMIPADRDVFTAIADAVAEPTVLDVAAATAAAPSTSITVDQHVTADGATTVGRLVIRAASNAKVTVIHRVHSGDISGLFLPLVEIDAAAGANVRYVFVQELGPRMNQIGSLATRTARDASLSVMAVALGGSYARLRADAELTGPGGHNELLAVYFGEREQVLDFRTAQNHVAPRCSSDLVFKGAVEDTARSVYSGLIKIGADAAKTSASQTNRNLILSPTASAESVPNLEIENNDVKCSHASAIGPIDDDQKYYLESRGVPTDVATRLIVIGFFSELLDRLPDEALRNRLVDAITAKFDRRGASA